MNATNPYEPCDSDTKPPNFRRASYGIALLVLLTIIGLLGYSAVVVLFFIVKLAASCVALLPSATLLMMQRRVTMDRIGQSIIAAGVLLIVDAVVTATMVMLLLHRPWVLDLNPLDRMIASTLNFVCPALVLSFAFAALWPSSQPKRFVWIGGLVASIGVIAEAATGYYLIESVLGERLAMHVWWL